MRFFGFFGLFLVFMFLAVKSCTDKSKKTEFVNAENITKLAKDKGKNSEEMDEFIEDVREDIKKQEKVAKKLTAKDVEKLEDKNIKKKEIKKIVEKKKEVKKPVAKKPAAKKYTGSTVMVKSFNALDSYSKLQLKKGIKAINAKGSGKVSIYGTYLPGEQKSKGFIRAANVRNELFKLGLKSNISVFMLPEQRSKKDASAKVVFK